MEDELSEWKKMVKDKRRDFYELNYFSTLQLLTLRKELGTIKNSERSRAVVPPNAIMLLQSISSQITSSLVCDVIHRVGSVPITEVMESEDVTDDNQSFSPVSMMEDSAAKQTFAKSTVSHDSLNAKDDLSPEERGIMDYIIQRLSYPKPLILKALETYRGEEGWDKYDIQTWCQNNAENFNNTEEVGDFADKEESEGEGSYTSDSDEEFTSTQGRKFC